VSNGMKTVTAPNFLDEFAKEFEPLETHSQLIELVDQEDRCALLTSSNH
jgi:hypothetical protein